MLFLARPTKQTASSCLLRAFHTNQDAAEKRQTRLCLSVDICCRSGLHQAIMCPELHVLLGQTLALGQTLTTPRAEAGRQAGVESKADNAMRRVIPLSAL